MTDPRLFTPAYERNAAPILEVISRVFPASGVVLEVASGSGQHALHFAQALPGLTFQPSDPEADRRASIDAWAAGAANIRPALDLDASTPWQGLAADAVLCINMTHISPWPATEGLMRNAASVLPEGGVLAMYGPFLRDGVPTTPGNAAFDADLRQRNKLWGLRDIEVVAACAAGAGFGAPEIVGMPADNFMLIFRKAA